MKKISLIATSLLFAVVFAVSAFGQAPAAGTTGVAATKIGWIDTSAFGDDKAGVNKYNNALKALEAEMKPRVTELQGLQAKLQTISNDLKNMQGSTGTGVPLDPRAAAAKQEEGQKLQREFEFKKKEYDAAMANAR